jgi:hypothetical protein
MAPTHMRRVLLFPGDQCIAKKRTGKVVIPIVGATILQPNKIGLTLRAAGKLILVF